MTKKTATRDATDLFGKFASDFQEFQARFGFQPASRDAALKGLATGREQLGTARQTFSATTDRVETMAGAAADAYALAVREMAEAGFANVGLAFDAMETMLTATSPAEAFKAQADLLQTVAKANAERARLAAEAAQKAIAVNAEQIRSEVEKLNPLGRMAA